MEAEELLDKQTESELSGCESIKYWFIYRMWDTNININNISLLLYLLVLVSLWLSFGLGLCIKDCIWSGGGGGWTIRWRIWFRLFIWFSFGVIRRWVIVPIFFYRGCPYSNRQIFWGIFFIFWIWVIYWWFIIFSWNDCRCDCVIIFLYRWIYFFSSLLYLEFIVIWVV